MQTATYSHVGSLGIEVDFQVPPSVTKGVLPGVIFFHGGGLVAGSRTRETFPWILGQSQTLPHAAESKLTRARGQNPHTRKA